MQGVLKSLDGIIDRAENALSVSAADSAAAGLPPAAGSTVVAAADAPADGLPPARKKKEKKPKKPKAPAAPSLPPSSAHFLQCDLRAGVIRSVTPHPEGDALYVLSVDVGDAESRSICAGLREFVAESELLGASVVAICNLKPRMLRGVASEGMLLAGSVVKEEGGKERVVPLRPPEGMAAGEVVRVEGMQGERAVVEGKFVNAKTWGKVVARLAVKEGMACYEGKRMVVGEGEGAVQCGLPDGAEIH